MLTCVGIEADQVCVDGCDKHRVAKDGDSAIRRRATQRQPIGHRPLVCPDHFARPGIERDVPFASLGYKHHAIRNDRGNLQFSIDVAQLGNPGETQLVNCVFDDLGKQRMPVSEIVPAVSQPLRRVVIRIQYSFGTDVHRDARGGNGIRFGRLSRRPKSLVPHVCMHLPYLGIPERLCLH